MFYIGRVMWGTPEDYTQDFHVIKADSRGEAKEKLLAAFDFSIAVYPDVVEISEAEGDFPVIFVASVSHRSIAHLGGQSTSEAKAAAARRNGRKGGRPRKTAE